MKVDRLELKNYRSAKEITFEFSDKLNLFVGVNGAGKSTVLDGLSTCLSWLIKRVERESGRGQQISESSISSGADAGYLDVHLQHLNSSWRWSLAKTVKGKSSTYDSSFGGVTNLAKKMKDSHEQMRRWPVIAYYPVSRVVKNSSPVLSSQQSITAGNVYENALGGEVNYQEFFEWFRLQDDVLNEKTASRTNWMRQNKSWIKENVKRITDAFISSFQSKIPAHEHNDLVREIERLHMHESIYETPMFLFRQLVHVVDLLGVRSVTYSKYDSVFKEMNRVFYSIDRLGSSLNKDAIEESEPSQKLLAIMFESFQQPLMGMNSDKKLALFLWDAYSYSLALNVWWMSDTGMRDLEAAFRHIEDALESESNAPITVDAFGIAFDKIISRELAKKRISPQANGLGLKIVAEAIEQFLPEFTALRVERMPRPHVLVNKNNQTFDLDQLSDGEKNTIALVGDIARRLALGNPQETNPLLGEGVILIDEVDLHLHPRWQRLIVPRLLEVFPNCQFFISTHSPQILSHVKPEHVFLLEQTEDGMQFDRPSETYGMSLDRAVELVMGDESRPHTVRENLEELFEMIERKKLSKAKERIDDLKKDMLNDPEIMRAEMLIRKEELKG